MIDTMHLFVTSKCTNNCPLCCNNNYDVEDIPIPSEEELSSVENIFLTGGEPFLLGEKLNKIVATLRTRNNIKNIYIYTSGYECFEYLKKFGNLPNINGVNFSPKTDKDWDALAKISFGWFQDFRNLRSNRLYVFIKEYDRGTFDLDNSNNLDIISEAYFNMNCRVFFRIWMNNIESRPHEIFRRLESYD